MSLELKRKHEIFVFVMAKEILLYWGINDWTVEYLINQLEDYKREKVTMRVNSPGGSVYAAYGLFAKMIEHGNVHVKIDGIAASGAGILPLFAKSAEALDVSTGMIHRASMDGRDKDLTDEQKQRLNKVNADLRKQVESKISSDKFKAVTGKSIDELFSMEGRIDVWLNADQMMQLGIINKITPLTPAMQEKLSSFSENWATQIAASMGPESNSNPENMTAEEIKSKYPAVYQSIHAEGVQAGEKVGIDKERKRVETINVFHEVDPKRCAEMISKGEELSMKDIAEFNIKMSSGKDLKALEKDSKGAVETEKKDKPEATTEKTAEAKELEAYSASIDKVLGRTTKAA